MSNALSEILVRATEEGAFGNVQFDSLNVDDSSAKGPQFMSTVSFVTIRVRDSTSGAVRDVPLVVKVQPDNGAQRSAMNSDAMFANEVWMYETIIQELSGGRCNLFPKCYYCRAEGGENFKRDVVVLEDMRSQEFRVPSQKIFLDLPHLILALERIGEFHGLSYKFKRNNENLEILKNKLRPTKYSKSWLETVKPFLVFNTKRFADTLVEQGYDGTQFDKLLQKYDDLEGFLKFVTQPQEPFAVVCHGDFNRNNFLYKYDSDGLPVDVKFFDLQNSVYSDPVLDLFFFLYMNTTSAIRQSHWNQLLDVYWDGVLASAPQPGFSRSEFFDNIEKKAFVGFVEPQFFIPSMMGNVNSDDFSKLFSEPIESQLKVFSEKGGSAAYEAVRDIMQHLVDNNAVQRIVEL